MRAPVVPTFIPQRPRRSYGGGALSVFLHGLLIFAIVSPWLRRYYTLSDNPSGLPGMGGGGGSGGEQYIALAALRPAAKPAPPPVETQVPKPVVQPPVEVPTEIPPPEPKPDTLPSTPVTPTEGATGTDGGGAAGTGGGSGGGVGGGQGPGTGSGAGPGTGGSLRGRPPEQRQMVIPPMTGTPRDLRGDTVVVRFFVSSSGAVDRIETTPLLPSGRFRQDFYELMLDYKFRPARDSLGLPVNGITSALVVLSNQ
jgi:hypothetical protein